MLFPILGLMLLIAFITILSSYANNKVKRDLVILDAIGHLEDNFYDIALDIQQLNITTSSQSSDITSRLTKSTTQIDTLFDALQSGGSYQNSADKTIKVNELKTESSRSELLKLSVIWQDYKTQLSNLNDPVATTKLANFVYAQKNSISTSINTIAADSFAYTYRWNTIVRYILLIGPLLISLYIAGLAWFYFNRVSSSENQLQMAGKRSDEILSAVNEGLFLIDKDLVIADEYSKALEGIVNHTKLAGKRLPDILSKLVSPKDLEDTKTFVGQLFSEWVVEDLVTDLNPLKKLRTQVPTELGGYEERFLDFRFSRVYEEDEVVRILVSVRDISDAVRLEKNLESEKQQSDRQLEMLSTIMNSDPNILQHFIDSTLVRIDNINDILKTPGSTKKELMNKATEIYRELHSLKGESSAMQLDSFVSRSEDAETKVKYLIDKREISGNEFLSLAIDLDELLNLTIFVKNLTDRIGFIGEGINEQVNVFANNEKPEIFDKKLAKAHEQLVHETTQTKQLMPQSAHNLDANLDSSNGSMAEEATQSLNPDTTQNIANTSPESADSIANFYNQFAQEIAKRNHKQISFQCLGMDNVMLTPEQVNLVKDISIQLLRNSIVHGIEAPQVRQQKDKPPVGRVNLILEENLNEGTATLSIMDDGQGIQYEKLRQAALASGKYHPDKVAKWTKKELLRLMFVPNLSTAETSTEDAGRGIGMDVVKTLVGKLKGKLQINSKADEYTRFSIIFPTFH